MQDATASSFACLDFPLDGPGQEFGSLNYLAQRLQLMADFGQTYQNVQTVFATCDEPDFVLGDAGGWTDAGEQLPHDLVLEGRCKELASWLKFQVISEKDPSEIPA